MEEILDAAALEQVLAESALRIARDLRHVDSCAIIGVQTRGVPIAEGLRERLQQELNRTIPMGILDITFYRDDLTTRGHLPEIKETIINFDIEGRTILLVDDVLYTGRTTKAALETLMSYGRPAAIKLYALVDRGHRQLPIQPDYVGITVDTDLGDEVKVLLRDTDDVDAHQVLLVRKNSQEE